MNEKNAIHNQNTKKMKRRRIQSHLHDNISSPNSGCTRCIRSYTVKDSDIRILMRENLHTHKNIFPYCSRVADAHTNSCLHLHSDAPKPVIWAQSIWNSLNLPYEVWESMWRQTQANHTHILCTITHTFTYTTPHPRAEAEHYVILALYPLGNSD